MTKISVDELEILKGKLSEAVKKPQTYGQLAPLQAELDAADASRYHDDGSLPDDDNLALIDECYGEFFFAHRDASSVVSSLEAGDFARNADARAKEQGFIPDAFSSRWLGQQKKTIRHLFVGRSILFFSLSRGMPLSVHGPGFFPDALASVRHGL